MEILNTYFSPNPTKLDIDTTFREVAEHGDLLFPIGVHYTDHSSNREIMIHKHWHKEIEILYITKNCMLLEIENHSFLASKGDIIFIPPNSLHGAYQYQHFSCAFFAIVFDPFFIASYTNDRIQQSYIEPLIKNPDFSFSYIHGDNPYLPQLRQVIVSIIENFNNSYAHEIFIKSKLMEFLYLFYMIHPENNHYIRTKEDITFSLRIKKIMLFIEDNYKSPLTLDIVSNHVGISREHFCRFFKKHFRLSFSDYLARYRIAKAERLLINTDSPIIEIALETGFDSASYFASVFKKINGITPTQFKKNINNL